MKKTWEKHPLLIPRTGSRIAFPKDKQLQPAHAVAYYRLMSVAYGDYQTSGYNTPNVDASLRIFLGPSLRDLYVEDNVRKRPSPRLKVYGGVVKTPMYSRTRHFHNVTTLLHPYKRAVEVRGKDSE